jgi:hypothetical protein
VYSKDVVDLLMLFMHSTRASDVAGCITPGWANSLNFSAAAELVTSHISTDQRGSGGAAPAVMGPSPPVCCVA